MLYGGKVEVGTG